MSAPQRLFYQKCLALDVPQKTPIGSKFPQRHYLHSQRPPNYNNRRGERTCGEYRNYTYIYTYMYGKRCNRGGKSEAQSLCNDRSSRCNYCDRAIGPLNGCCRFKCLSELFETDNKAYIQVASLLPTIHICVLGSASNHKPKIRFKLCHKRGGVLKVISFGTSIWCVILLLPTLWPQA